MPNKIVVGEGSGPQAWLKLHDNLDGTYSYNVAEDGNLLTVANGTSGVHYMSKYGYNPSAGTAAEPVWAESGVAYTYLAAGTAMTISSSGTADTSAGPGARTVYVEGLDSSFDRALATATMNGTTAVALGTFTRVYRAYVVTAGATGANSGIVYVGYGALTAGKPDTVQASIAAGNGQTLQAIYTIPNGKTGYLRGFDAYASAAGVVSVWMRPSGEAWRALRQFPIQSYIDHAFSIPVKLTAKTDIEVRMTGGAAGIKVGATFDIDLE